MLDADWHLFETMLHHRAFAPACRSMKSTRNFLPRPSAVKDAQPQSAWKTSEYGNGPATRAVRIIPATSMQPWTFSRGSVADLRKKSPSFGRGGCQKRRDSTPTNSRLFVESDHCRKVELTVSATTHDLIKLLRKRTHECLLLRKLGCLGGKTEIL